MVKTITRQRFKGHVHCPICSHTVGAEVEQVGKTVRVIPGQKCSRCSATLDVAAVLQILEAA